jgi:hypothetical protein
MNIRLDGSGHTALYASDGCPFCGRPLPEEGACPCGVWKRIRLTAPTYLIELTPKGPELAKDSNYWVEQYKAANAEKERAA